MNRLFDTAPWLLVICLAFFVDSVPANGHSVHDAATSHDMHTMAATSPLDPATTQVTFELLPSHGTDIVAGEELRAVVRITDSHTGLPVTDQSVAGWMMLQRNRQVSAELSCTAKSTLFSRGQVTTRPDVDLNLTRMMILNRDGTIGIANPQVDFTITQLEGVIPLPGVPADWVMSSDEQSVYVSLPIFAAIAVIDTRSRQITGLLETGKGSLPTQLTLLPDGRIAVYLSGTQSVTVLAADNAEDMAASMAQGMAHDMAAGRDAQQGAPRSLAVGAGPVALANTPNGRMYVASSDGQLTVIDTHSMNTVSSIRVPAGEPSLVVSPYSQMLYVASQDAADVKVLNPETLALQRTINLPVGTANLAMEPRGRQLLAVNRKTSKLTLIDTGNDSIIAEQLVARTPVEIAFTHDYAYIRGLEGDHFSVLELAQLRSGHLNAVNVQSAAQPMVKREALAHARLIAPYGHGALIGNADEAVAYYYMEGMNTAMGTLQMYGRNVQGLLTLDHGFRETAPGIYETATTLPHGGVYDVPIRVGEPALNVCFSVTVQPGKETVQAHSSPSVEVEPVDATATTARQPGTWIVRIVDAQTHEPAIGLRDVRMLAFSSSGTWQARKWASDLGDGRYASQWTFPSEGRYGVSVEVASRELDFNDQPPVYLKVEPATEQGTIKLTGSTR